MNLSVSPRVLRAITALLLMTGALVYLQTGLYSPLNIYDEGIIVYGSVRVMDGQVPYRDFWTQYSPGQLYVLAALFGTLGKSIMVERVWDITIRATLALMIFVLGARLSSVKASVPLWVLALLWVQHYGFFGYPIFAGLLFSLASIHALIRGFSSRRWMFASGSLLGLTAIFRHDMAVYVAAAQLITFVPLAMWRLASPASPQLQLVTYAIRRLLPWAGGTLIVITPVLAYFLATVPANQLAQQLFIFPLTEFPKVRDLPYPDLDWWPNNLPFYAPFPIYAIAFSMAVAHIRREPQTADYDGYRVWGIIMMVLFGVFGFNQARVRSDEIHTVQFFLSALTLLPALWHGISRAARWLSYVIAMTSVVLAIAAIVNPIDHYVRQLEGRANAARNLNHGLPIAQGALVSLDHNFAVRYLQRLTKPGDKVYIGLSQHDRVFANDVMFYFLLERHSPTRYHELHPGLANTEPVQREMIADIERNAVKYVVLTSMFQGANEPNDSALSSGVELLDDYLRTHYQWVTTIGAYRIYVRRD